MKEDNVRKDYRRDHRICITQPVLEGLIASVNCQTLCEISAIMPSLPKMKNKQGAACVCNYAVSQSVIIDISVKESTFYYFVEGSHRISPSYLLNLCVCAFLCAYTIFTRVAEVDEVELTSAAPNELPRLQWAPPQEVPLWDITNCTLEDGQILISQEDDVTKHSHQLSLNNVTLPLWCCCKYNKIIIMCVSFFSANDVDPKPCQ